MCVCVCKACICATTILMMLTMKQSFNSGTQYCAVTVAVRRRPRNGTRCSIAWTDAGNQPYN